MRPLRSSAPAGAGRGHGAGVAQPEPPARSRVPGAHLSGVWLGVRRGWRLQFSVLFLHLLGGKATLLLPSGSPRSTPKLPYFCPRAVLFPPAHPVYLYCSGTPCTLLPPAAPAVSTHEPALSYCKTYRLLPSPPSRFLSSTPGVGASFLLGQIRFSLPCSLAAPRFCHDRSKNRNYLPFCKQRQSWTPRLLGTHLFPSPPRTRSILSCRPLHSTPQQCPPPRPRPERSFPALCSCFCLLRTRCSALAAELSPLPPPIWETLKSAWLGS